MFSIFHKIKYVLLVAGLLMQACASASAPPPTDPEPIQLKVAVVPWLSLAPFYIAQDEGYYAEQGLEVELVEIAHQEIIPAVTQGRVDVSSGLVGAGIFNAISRGGNLKIVADKGYIGTDDCNSIAIVARKSLAEAENLNDPANLKGRLVHVFTASWLEYYWDKSLAAINLTHDDVQYADVAVPALIEALNKDTLDVVVQNEPWITRMIMAGHQPVLTPLNELMPDAQYAVTFYGPNLLEKNPEAGKRFMVAYLKAVRQFNQGKTERNIDILSKYIGLDIEQLNQVCWPVLQDNGQLHVESVMDFQDWAVDKGLLDKPVTEDKFWDPGFVEYANEVLDKAASK